MSSLTDILHKILSVAEGESAQRVIHDEIDALSAATGEAAPKAPSAPEEPSEAEPAPVVPPAAAEAFQGTESAPEVADAQ